MVLLGSRVRDQELQTVHSTTIIFNPQPCFIVTVAIVILIRGRRSEVSLKTVTYFNAVNQKVKALFDYSHSTPEPSDPDLIVDINLWYHEEKMQKPPSAPKPNQRKFSSATMFSEVTPPSFYLAEVLSVNPWKSIHSTWPVSNPSHYNLNWVYCECNLEGQSHTV